MKPILIFASLLTLLICMPIWYYLLYSLLAAIHPDRLVWFLFWIYITVGFLSAAIRASIDVAAKKTGA